MTLVRYKHFGFGRPTQIHEKKLHGVRLGAVPIRCTTKTKIAVAKNISRAARESRNVNRKRREYASYVTLLFIFCLENESRA